MAEVPSIEMPVALKDTNTRSALIVGGMMMIGLIVGLVGGAAVLKSSVTDLIAPDVSPDVSPDVPNPVDLKSIAGESAPKIGQFYRDLAAVVNGDTDLDIKTSGQFRRAQYAAVGYLITAGRLPSIKGLEIPIDQRVNAAIGNQDQPLTDELRKKLVDALNGIADELTGV